MEADSRKTDPSVDRSPRLECTPSPLPEAGSRQVPPARIELAHAVWEPRALRSTMRCLRAARQCARHSAIGRVRPLEVHLPHPGRHGHVRERPRPCRRSRPTRRKDQHPVPPPALAPSRVEGLRTSGSSTQSLAALLATGKTRVGSSAHSVRKRVRPGSRKRYPVDCAHLGAHGYRGLGRRRAFGGFPVASSSLGLNDALRRSHLVGHEGDLCG